MPKNEIVNNDNVYTKEQILKSKKYKNRADLLKAILKDSKQYTLDQVNNEIEKFMKRKV